MNMCTFKRTFYFILIFTITDTKPCLWKNALRPLFLLFIRILTTKNTLMNSKLMEKENKLSYISVRSQDTSLENIILCGVLRLSAQP